MRRIALVTLALVVATVPALFGLLGNASFAQRLPLRSPTSTSAPSATEVPTRRHVTTSAARWHARAHPTWHPPTHVTTARPPPPGPLRSRV